MRVVSFGDAMIRFAPGEHDGTWQPSGRKDYILTVAGDELNVCVALAQLETPAEWISVLPDNSLGKMCTQSALDTGVNLDGLQIDTSDEAEMGIFLVVPEKKTVEYQRRNSSFAKQQPRTFDWNAIYGANTSWLHCTGITPAISAGPKEMFCEALDAATAAGISISCDLNHRPQLGTLEDLWDTVRPYVSSMKVIILSIAQMRGLAVIEGFDNLQSLPAQDADVNHEGWLGLMQFFQKKWAGPGVVCCFKRKADVNSKWGGVQRRWSVLVNETGAHTSDSMPVWHSPKDELGGGSAWAAGLIQMCLESGTDLPSAGPAGIVQVLRSADLMAALCQESFGDHSTVKLAEYMGAMARFEGTEAFVGLAETDVDPALRTATKCRL